jgi:hypothetical protein
LELVDNVEAAPIRHDCEYEFLLWMSDLGFVITSSLARVNMRRSDVLKTTMTHHWLRGDANYLFRQYTRRVKLPLHIPFVSRTTRPSKHTEPNVNGTIWNQETDINAVTLLHSQQAEHLLSTELIQKMICLI